MAEPYPGYFLVPESWAMVAPAMALACLLLALDQFRLPIQQTVMPAAIAVVTAACANLFVRAERVERRSLAARYGIMALAVAMPMALFGTAMAMWHHVEPLHTPLPIVGALVITSLVVAVSLSGRVPSLVAAALALWAAPALEMHNLGATLMLLLGGIMGAAAAVRQVALDRAAQAEARELRRLQKRAEDILHDYEQTGQGWFWETDRKGMITYVSAPIGRVLGTDPSVLMGRPLSDLFILDSASREGERTLLFQMNARSSFQELPVRAATQKEERWWSINGRPIYDNFNNFLGFRGSGSDLTEKRRTEQHATRLAHFDSLTGLANRFQMSQTLEKILNAPHASHRSCAVFLLDLDRFKQVNDTMGHPVGDVLLKQVAKRLSETVGDLGRVGRLGGDEFKVVMPGYHDKGLLADVAQRIIDNLSEPYIIEGARVVIGASVGIALSPEDGVTSEAIIRNADLALYAAKDRGRGVYHFYAADLHSDAEERRQLETDLRDALIHGGLRLTYQPVVQTATETITGFEALLRWQHPTRGNLSPALFIPIAEEAGLIAQIGEWALRTACMDLARWPDSVRVAVNVSPLQFANPALPGIVTHALASAQVRPARLELEITESVFLGDSEATEAMFAALKGVGVRLALDDFGTGYSSLGYLKNAPFDKIKIDQGFVRGATEPESRNGAIIASIVSLAEALGMETTAEGVETHDELNLIRELGCSHVQGYIYSRPLEREEADERLAGGNLAMVASGPRSTRPPRRTMLRAVVMEAMGARYPVTVRNMSARGAMIDGVRDVPVGIDLALELGDSMVMFGTVRWSRDGRTGIEFVQPVSFDEAGGIVMG
ncbi:MAG: EAL domain-containing protein [Sphingomonadales bacterium]|nr:EAL domain-containing protein [Sphingomonadales bacterium]MDE2168013.1 EAL domain-containing protein [Sphingomonadales bacterium]